MLYNGSEVIRDLEWVIFDEVHYINDAEVREQSFLPPVLQVEEALMSFPAFLLLERSCVGGGADHAPGSRQHHPPQRHRAERSGVQRVDRVSGCWTNRKQHLSK